MTEAHSHPDLTPETSTGIYIPPTIPSYGDFLQACLDDEVAFKEQGRVRGLIANAESPC